MLDIIQLNRMAKWILLSTVCALLLVCLWRLRRPRWFWSQDLDRRVNILVAAVSVVSLVVAVVTLAIAFEALREARSSGSEQLTTLQRSREALEKVITSLGTQVGLLTDAQTSLRAQLDLGKKQFAIQESQYEAQSKRPLLEVEALIYTSVPGVRTYSRALLHPTNLPGSQSTEMNLLVQSDTRYREASFFVRNIGTAPAVNVTVVPRVAIDVGVRCIDYPDISIGSQGRNAAACATPSGILPPIPPQPKGHPTHLPDTETRLAFNTDPAFEAKVRVNMIAPVDIPAFELELMVSADGLAPTRYVVFCHNLPFE